MPFKNDRRTPQEKIFAAAMASTGDKHYAATKAGYSHPNVQANVVLSRPGIQSDVARIQMERLYNDALPLAVNTLISIMGDEKAPAGARVSASKEVLDRTIGRDEAGGAKDPHEMTPDELAKALADAKLRATALERVKAERAKPIIEHEADQAEHNLFG